MKKNFEFEEFELAVFRNFEIIPFEVSDPQIFYPKKLNRRCFRHKKMLKNVKRKVFWPSKPNRVSGKIGKIESLQELGAPGGFL